MKKIFILIFISALVAGIFSAEAQQRRKASRRYSYNNNLYGIWKFTAGAGVATYKGDLGGPPNSKINTLGPNLYLGAQYRLTSRWSLKGELGWYRLAASDADGKNPQRNFAFRSNNFEVNVGGMFDIIPFTRRFTRVAITRFHPYLFAGIGITTFNPQGQYSDGKWYSLRPLQTEGKKYGSIALTVPMGLGVRYRYNKDFDISLEGSYHFTSTDYLDDVSGDYNKDAVNSPDPIRSYFANRSIDPKTGSPATINYDYAFTRKRGDPTKKDGYFLLSLKLEYNTVPNANFPRKIKRGRSSRSKSRGSSSGKSHPNNKKSQP